MNVFVEDPTRPTEVDPIDAAFERCSQGDALNYIMSNSPIETMILDVTLGCDVVQDIVRAAFLVGKPKRIVVYFDTLPTPDLRKEDWVISPDLPRDQNVRRIHGKKNMSFEHVIRLFLASTFLAHTYTSGQLIHSE
jgi:hypothetical protein